MCYYRFQVLENRKPRIFLILQMPESRSDLGPRDRGSLSVQSVKPFIYFTGERQVSFPSSQTIEIFTKGNEKLSEPKHLFLAGMPIWSRITLSDHWATSLWLFETRPESWSTSCKSFSRSSANLPPSWTFSSSISLAAWSSQEMWVQTYTNHTFPLHRWTWTHSYSVHSHNCNLFYLFTQDSRHYLNVFNVVLVETGSSPLAINSPRSRQQIQSISTLFNAERLASCNYWMPADGSIHYV